MAVRLGSPARLAVVLALVLLSGCRGEAPVAHKVATPGPPDTLHELVDRRVLSSRPVDNCLERWGKGKAGWFALDFEIDPSGQLTPLEAHGGDDNLNDCLFGALHKIRLPPGSVSEPQRASISIR